MRSVTIQPPQCPQCSELRSGFKFELGANWMQGYRQGVPFFDFVDKYVNLKGTPTDFDDSYFVENGKLVEDEIADPVWTRAEQAMAKVYAFKNAMTATKSEAPTMNLASALLFAAGFEANDPIATSAIRFEVDFEYAVPANDVSLRGLSPIYDPEAPDSEDFFVADPRGYKAAVDIALKQAGVPSVNRSSSKLLLNSPVRTIVYGEKRASVITRDGEEIVGSAVVSTLPLGVLQASLLENPEDSNVVQFVPPLSIERKLAISKLDMADYLKIFVQFKQPLFTDEDPLFMLPLNCAEGGFLNVQNLNKKEYFPGSNAVVVTSTDAYSRDLLCMDRERVLDDVLEYVSMALGRKLHRDDVASFQVPHFRRAEFFRGSYTVISPSTTKEDIEEFNKPNRTLFVAGEAHNTQGLNGYVHGAWDSGMVTANAVAEFLKC
ncbi:Amine oxidase [Gracilaria domingensis]|nr:Amine oxidase [Gracilaria domingensis]